MTTPSGFEPEVGHIVSRVATFYNPLNAKRVVAFFLDGTGEPVGLEVDGRVYRVKPSPRFSIHLWRTYQPMIEWSVVDSSERPAEPTPAA